MSGDHRRRHRARRRRDDGSPHHRCSRGRRAPGISEDRRGADRRARRPEGRSRRAVRDRRSDLPARRRGHDRDRARRGRERERIWKGRKAAFAAMGRVSPNYYVQDGVVPRTRLPEVLRRIRALEARSGLRIGNVFHAGDGNLHPLICYDESIPGQAEHAERVASEILSYCIEAGGAITGEHGVGADKKAYMPRMFGARRSRRRCSSCAARSIRPASATRERSFPRRGCAARCQGPTASIRSSGPALRSGFDGAALTHRTDVAALAAFLARGQPGPDSRCIRAAAGRNRAWWAGAAERAAILSTTGLAPRHRSLRGRSDGDGRRRHDARGGQCGARPHRANGCRSIRRPPTARPSAASSPPTTAARAATSTARRAI